MDVATGALGSLLPMLVELLKEEYKLQTGVKKDIESVQLELGSMHAALSKVAEVPRDQLDKQVRHWADEVREMSYDADDLVDAFLVRIVGHQLIEHSCFKHLMEKMAKVFKKAKARRQIATAIRDIKAKVQDVAARRDRYKIDSVGPFAPTPTTVDPRLLSLYKDKKEIVGIQEPMDNIVKRLTDGDDEESKNQLKILSIFGPGGLGKTTLAKAVYDRLPWQQYPRRSFVSVGRNPDVKKVLKGILLQLDKENYVKFNMATFDEEPLIGEVRKLLENTRYLIVIDDIWDITTWDIIRCALVDNNNGSRIITTTRKFDVATKVATKDDDIHKLEPLSPDNSKELFNRRLYGRNGKCTDEKLPEVSEKLLHKCDGVPLAIITLASLLATKPRHDWPKVYDSIGFSYEENEEGRNAMKILMFSYYDLPSSLKTCLLHLCTFPEDHLIKKRNLIWKWVAEGFIMEESRLGSYEVGERHFNELIDRSMIQPIHKPGLGIINGCRVHDMVLDMICLISKEENFVTKLDSNELHNSSQRKARRLAIQKRKVQQHDPLDNRNMVHVRSFNAIMCHFYMVPSLSKFKVLRVLAMEDCTFMGNGPWHLENLGRLLQLRFLGLRGTPIFELPKEIGNLMFLLTLDLKGTAILELPESVGLLRQLKCLHTETGVSDWIGNLTSLQELQFHIAHTLPNFMEDLGKLTQLRVLRIRVGELLDETDWDCFVPPRKLLRLSVPFGFFRLPTWINSSLLPNLCHLDLGVDTLNAGDLEILGMLKELLTLKLYAPDEISSFEIMGNGAFPKLRYFWLRAPVNIKFVQGAMPSLQSIRLSFKLSNNFDFSSWRNLTCLEEIMVDMECRGLKGPWTKVEEAEAALRQAIIDNHPNSPTLHIRTTYFGVSSSEWPYSDWQEYTKPMNMGLESEEESRLGNIVSDSEGGETSRKP